MPAGASKTTARPSARDRRALGRAVRQHSGGALSGQHGGPGGDVAHHDVGALLSLTSPRRGWSRRPTRTRPGCRRTRRPGRRRPPRWPSAPAEFDRDQIHRAGDEVLAEDVLVRVGVLRGQVGGRGGEHHVAAVARDRELDVSDVLRVDGGVRRHAGRVRRGEGRGARRPGPARRAETPPVGTPVRRGRGERHVPAVGGDGGGVGGRRALRAPAEVSETRLVSPGAPSASPAPRAATAAEARTREGTRRIRAILPLSTGSWQPPWVEVRALSAGR